MAERGPGSQNVLVPTFDPASTGAIQAEFTRNPDSFAMNGYTQLIPVTEGSGFYLKIETEEMARVVLDAEYIWPDGGDRPIPREADHEFVQYTTKRFATSFRLGHKTRDQAKWDIVASHARIKAQKAMTLRTKRILDLALASGNWGGNTAAASGAWDTSGTADNFIQIDTRNAVQAIVLATNGAVQPKDIQMVLGPNDAGDMASAPEILQYVTSQPAGSAFLQGTVPWDTWGLPSKLFGANLIVEDAVRVTTRKGVATTTREFMVDDEALFVSRPGGLVGVAGAPSFATLGLFVLEDMTVETADDPWNRRIMGSVVDDNDPAIIANVSGYLTTNIHA